MSHPTQTSQEPHASHGLRSQPALLWKFMGFFQKPFTRILHALIVVLVAMQLFGGLGVSPLMYGQPLSEAFPLWGHATGGVLILLLSLVMAAHSLYDRGLAHFFPYLFGDTAQLRRDIQDSLHCKLVGPRPGGLASAVQGLGLGALLLTGLSGALWLVLRREGASFAAELPDLHSVAAILLSIYFAAHGTMALLHFRLWQRKVSAQS